MITHISSASNKIVKLAASLDKKKYREEHGLYIAEGFRISKDAINDAFDRLHCLITSESFADENADFLQGYSNTCDIFVISDSIFSKASLTKNSQGIAAIVKIKSSQLQSLKEFKYVLILDGVSEPGNMGTIIRTAEAMGVEAVILCEDCADIYNPKVVRSTMGSIFRMNFLNISRQSIIKMLKDSGFTIISTALKNSVPLQNAVKPDMRAVVIGNEAHGVSDEMIEASDLCVKIEMVGKAESLNAAIASGILMYQMR